MSKSDDATVQDSFKKRPVLHPRGQIKEHFLVINHHWLVPIRTLKRFNSLSNNNDNELESICFPDDEPFDSHWQLFIEHQSHPSRIRIGFALLAPRHRCLRADVKFIFVTTHGGQIIKESLFYDHMFFLSEGESISSYINDNISPKIYLDIENELYENVVNGSQQGNLFNTNDCTIMVYVKFLNDFDIEPKSKAFDFSRRFTVDWKLVKFRHILEQMNQTRLTADKHRRLVSDRFQFSHVRFVDDFKINHKWKLQFVNTRTSSFNKQTPYYFILQSLNSTQSTYGKYEIQCKNEHNILRRYIDSMKDLNDKSPIEFFSLNELSTNIYQYKQNFNENNGRSVIIDYLLFSIQIIQPLQRSELRKKINRIVEPVIISLTNSGNVRHRKDEILQKTSPKEQRIKSVLLENRDPQPVMSTNDGKSTNQILPPIRIPNNSPSRLRSSSSLKLTLNVGNHLTYSFNPKPIRYHKSLPSSTSNQITNSTNGSFDRLNNNFAFLTNLFRSGLHSDITIYHHEHQWNLHKSILSSRSIYFNQYFSNANVSEINLTENYDTILKSIFDRVFLYIYTNQYRSEKLAQMSLFDTIRLLFETSIKFGIDKLTILCLEDMCNVENLTINTAAHILIALNQAINDPYEKYHSDDYLNQVKTLKTNVLRFIQTHSREILVSSQWKSLEKHYPYLVRDVLGFVVFEKLE